MLLQRLSEYAGHITLPPPMYRETNIRYVIVLDPGGNLLQTPPLDRATASEKRGPARLAPDRRRAYDIKPKLLADTAEYTLGLAREDSNPARVERQHTAYLEMVRDCAAQTGDPTVAAVAAFLDRLDLAALKLPDDFDRSATITFQVEGAHPEGAWPIDHRRVQAYWARVAAATGVHNNTVPMQCLVCGQVRPCAERLAIAIKGVPGNAMGMSLISANSDAFLSYGLKASLIAPTCEECGLRFGNALNALLAQASTHLRVGDCQYIFWTRAPKPISWAQLLSEPESEDARAFIQSAWTTRESTARQFDPTPFYAAVLSGNNARVVVRDWLETTLSAARESLLRYFRLQRLLGYDGKEHHFSLNALTRATVNAKSKVEEPAPQVGQALLRLALHGDPLPAWLLYQAVRRTRAEQAVRPAQAALIKMVLLTQADWKEGDSDMAELDPGQRRPAYLCGRLLAELEAIQYAALGKTNRTIVDTYYGTASSAPATVFGRLLNGARAHLTKLRHEKPGAHRRLDLRLQEIMDDLQTFPRTLALMDQGLFALGYYHQKAADFKAAQERKAARGGVVAPDDVDEVEGVGEQGQ
jgi:CRISPR-associated protein Csd1